MTERKPALCEASSQKRQYLQSIFKKQECTSLRREGKTDLILSASFFFYLVTHRVWKVDALFVLQESTMHTRLHHNK